MPTHDLELHIDWTRCDGHGSCTELLPELLDVDDWGYPVARGALTVPRGLRGHAERAVDACPLAALRLVKPPHRPR